MFGVENTGRLKGVEAFDGNFLNRDDVARVVQGMDIMFYSVSGSATKGERSDAGRAHEHPGPASICFRAVEARVVTSTTHRAAARSGDQTRKATRTTVRFRYRPTASAEAHHRELHAFLRA